MSCPWPVLYGLCAALTSSSIPGVKGIRSEDATELLSVEGSVSEHLSVQARAVLCPAGLVRGPRTWQGDERASVQNEFEIVSTGGDMLDDSDQPIPLDSYIHSKMELAVSDETFDWKAALFFFRTHMNEFGLQRKFKDWLLAKGERPDELDHDLNNEDLQKGFVSAEFSTLFQLMKADLMEVITRTYFFELQHTTDYLNWKDLATSVISGHTFGQYMLASNPSDVHLGKGQRLELSSRVQIHSNFVDQWRRAYTACSPHRWDSPAFSAKEVAAIRNVSPDRWQQLDPNNDYWSAEGTFSP